VINPRLFDWYGIDTKKNLGIKNICPKPFDTVLIDKQGSCYLCECTGWLPQSVGNLHIHSLEDIVNSKMARELQTSITDGSYRYCNNQQCSYLLDARNNSVPWGETMPIKQIKNIRLAIDDSCNLSCPSCRNKQIFEKDKSKLRKQYRLANKIIDYVRSQSHTINIHVGSDGDPFASLVYRYFVKEIKNLPNIRFTIQTNGLLIKKIYERHEELFKKLDVLNISIDGATKDTYELLRRGGSYEKILENLETVKKLKRKYGFEFVLHYVVQEKNYFEMGKMIELAEQYDADRLWFNRITNWNTYVNFVEEDVLDKNNKNYNECVAQIKKIKNKNYNILIEMPTLVSKVFK
jgi:MoaA/NifB/PqqE/SkfB family radical SAM enzyme